MLFSSLEVTTPFCGIHILSFSMKNVLTCASESVSSISGITRAGEGSNEILASCMVLVTICSLQRALINIWHFTIKGTVYYNRIIATANKYTATTTSYFLDFYYVVGENFFIYWITLPADLKNCDFKKKKKKILPDTTMKLSVFCLIRNCRENNCFETSLSFNKLHKNDNKWGRCFFFLRSPI